MFGRQEQSAAGAEEPAVRGRGEEKRGAGLAEAEGRRVRPGTGHGKTCFGRSLKIPSDSWGSGAAAEETAVARRPRPEDQRHRQVGKGGRRCRCLRRRVSVPPIIQKWGSVVFSRRFLELPRCCPGHRRRVGAARRFPLLPTGRCRCRKSVGGTRPPASVLWKSWAQVVERNGQCWGTTISA